tara:strand:+ start:2833 stop:3882 length:1050 start_codon:yes stop_codon:yes gene_type:complete
MKRHFQYSLLDLVPVIQGGCPSDSFRNSLDLAQKAEAAGYARFWVAEHHNIPGVACAATSVLMTYLAAGTEKIRIGSGGVMLPNHAPLLIAEQFGTLEALFPGRIDLGMGRAPGGDTPTMRAMRRNRDNADHFPHSVQELQDYLGDRVAGREVHAIPGEGSNVPLYLLGSSTYSAQLAGRMGLPFAFASHFAPDHLGEALNLYRQGFRPSEQCSAPYVMVAVNILAADERAEAERMERGLHQQFLNMVRGRRREMAPPPDQLNWKTWEEAEVRRMTRYSAVGVIDEVRSQISEILEETEADEIVATAQAYDHDMRVRSFEIAAEVFREWKRFGLAGMKSSSPVFTSVTP